VPPSLVINNKVHCTQEPRIHFVDMYYLYPATQKDIGPRGFKRLRLLIAARREAEADNKIVLSPTSSLFKRKNSFLL
jgi:hypothetical protein